MLQMDHSNGDEGPAILQLRRWNPSRVRLDLSQFREAFISPTREILLLLSYQSEAMILPLTADSDEDEEFRDLCSEDTERMEPSTSGSVGMTYSNGSFDGKGLLKPNKYPFLCDVNSLAWGVCGDAYDRHEDASFREFLFVCGDHGVTVHCFRHPKKSSDAVETEELGALGNGVWVEWGPSVSAYHTNARDSATTLSCKGSESSAVNGTDGKWLRTFLTSVETFESDGSIWTRFPEKKNYPRYAEIVSFSIFRNIPLLDTVSCSRASSDNRKVWKDTELNHVDTCGTTNFGPRGEFMPEVLSNFLGIGEEMSSRCSRVFSSNSQQLIGFVLYLEETQSSNISSSERSTVLVAKIDSLGLHWACSVKLDNNLDKHVSIGWSDFKFTENLLACLSFSGLILFYDALTGEYIARVDVLRICGVNFQTSLQSEESFSVEGNTSKLNDMKMKQDDSASKTQGSVGKRIFKKLVIASYTSFLAAVDVHGAVYIICAGDYMPDKFYSYEKLFPHYQHLGLGMLIGWKVAGSEIYHQKVFHDESAYNSSSFSSIMNKTDTLKEDNGIMMKRMIQGRDRLVKVAPYNPHISGLSLASEIRDQSRRPLESSARLMRKIFLPPHRPCEDDIICFSPLGITHLMNKQGIKGNTGFDIIHSNLHVGLTIHDDRCLYSPWKMFKRTGIEIVSVGEAVPCAFEGFLYLVTDTGLSVALPSVSISPGLIPIESIVNRQERVNIDFEGQVGSIFTGRETAWASPAWKLELVDRVLVFEGPEKADQICLTNGWDQKISRMRRLQFALGYLKFEEIQKSLEMLVSVNLAEEGILRLLFVAVFLALHRVGNDGEVSAALRVLALGTQFATKMIRKYGLIKHREGADIVETTKGSLILASEKENESEISQRIREMAHYLEVIRSIQCRLSTRSRSRSLGLGNGRDGGMEANLSQEDSQALGLPMVAASLESPGQHEVPLITSAIGANDAEKLTLMPVHPLESENYVDSETHNDLAVLVSQEEVYQRKVLPSENPKDMIARWEIDNLDFKAVVKDALLAGRLPLAVLQLHLHRLRDLVADEEPHDTFTEVRDIGRAIAYDLFMEGETGVAVATLQRLGEDVETSLKQLAFGTVKRTLRIQVAEELKRSGYLGILESKQLDRLSYIERFYTSSSFWRTFSVRQKDLPRVSSSLNTPKEHKLQLLHSHLSTNSAIECGEIQGVVLGSWANVNDNSASPAAEEDVTITAYWVAAAVWLDAWDQRIIERIVLDQPLLMGAEASWESLLEYHVCHNNWDEVSILLDVIPLSVLSDGCLQISMDDLNSTSDVGCSSLSADYANYVCSPDDLDGVFMDVQNVKIFGFSDNNTCSTWLRRLIEQKLATKFIFLKEVWGGSADIVSLIFHSSFITSKYTGSSSNGNFSNINQIPHAGAIQAFHRLFAHHCALYNLPHLLDLFLDNHFLVMDNESLNSLLEAVGDCQWAKWLLFSRIRGREYDASFSNAHAIMSHNVVPTSNIGVLEIDEIIQTVDDIAEGGGEMAALATLMFAPFPIQNCLTTGSVNRHSNSSAQCTLENLSPALQRFPTLWRTLVAVCLGQDISCSYLGPPVKDVIGYSAMSDYLNWRAKIFFSSGRDASLSQMLPNWFSRDARRVIQLYVQGPLGWQSLADESAEALMHREIGFVLSDEDGEINTISWEAAIQKHIEEEFYASSLKETGPGLEPHLHRGRALAAFNHLLGVRVQSLKSQSTYTGQPESSVHGQTNVQSDVQTLLAHVTESEESVLSSVKPLAIVHFKDSVLVASCAFLLELCGLSATMLRVDVAALRRISSFYKSDEYSERCRLNSPKSSALHTAPHEGDITYSLARALADDYLHHAGVDTTQENAKFNYFSGQQPSRALLLVLHHLEKASLPLMADERGCGAWLLSGNGEGTELRFQQKSASQHWNLVTVFCQMHQIPLSTAYLAVLAKDNDWVGFLLEAQVGGYPLDTVIEVALNSFGDPRLKTHILTVLRGIQSRKKPCSSDNLDTTVKRGGSLLSDESMNFPVELFGILAECEQKENPGEALLIRAKELCWSILAMLASCFPDVSPLSCLTTWLEITAARETSSIKVNDIASQIAANTGAAVEATNSLPLSSRVIRIHYNRRNAKRRRLMEPVSLNPLEPDASDVCSSSTIAKISLTQGFIDEEEEKMEFGGCNQVSADSDGSIPLSRMVAVLCEQRLFLPLLRAFEMFLPSCALLPFIRALQAFSQMRLAEASAHLGSFSGRIKEEMPIQTSTVKEEHIENSWISSTAVKAADAILLTCPSPYEKRCLLQLLAAADFGDGGSAATYYRRLLWKINLAEPSLRKGDVLHLGSETLDDAELLKALEKNGYWEHARSWARQLEAMGGPWKSAVHHVTETQAESMVAEWREFLWDVPEERVALWVHCQMLFVRYSFPPIQAGLFFLKYAEAMEKDLPARELNELLLLSLEWLSGMTTLTNPVYPLHLLREIETRVWLLVVESESQVKSDGSYTSISSIREPVCGSGGNIIDRTASVIAKMDNHISNMRSRNKERNDIKDSQTQTKNSQAWDAGVSASTGGAMKTKRRAKGYVPSRRSLLDATDKSIDVEDHSNSLISKIYMPGQDENSRIEMSYSGWEERVGPAELERAVLSLLEFGQITAAKQLQEKLSPGDMPSEFIMVNAALKLATISTASSKLSVSELDMELRSVMQSYNLLNDSHFIDPLQILGSLATILTEGNGQGLCKRIIAILKAANILGLTFSEAFDKPPIEVLQLLSLKAQDSFEEANVLVRTHSMPAASIAQILAESFLKGLLAAHRGGYMDSQKEEGPAPLLWRFSDFLKWAELCPSEAEIGHALMRLVITGQEIPHACEVELLILSHHFYKSSACLDGVDVLVALAATRVEAYVSEGDFTCLARLITGVGNFHALNFILGILIENGQLDLLLQKFSAAADTNTGTAEAVRGFRMAVLTSLKHYNPNDLDAFALVYNHFDMKHETAALLESRAEQSSQSWFLRYDKDQNEDLLESMRYYIEAAEVHSSIDAGNKTQTACAQASLVSLQIRMPDLQWLNLSETNARRTLVEQSRFQEALIVAEAYGLNWPGEWALVLWNQMLKPDLTEQFVAEFVAVLPLQPSMLVDLSKFYRAEVAARGDQSQFSVWLTGGGLPAEWAKYLDRSFRCLLKRTRDLRLRLQLATMATGFSDVIDACSKALDKVPDIAGPLVLRKGHGGAYLPLM